MKFIGILIILSICLAGPGCAKKKKTNRVNLDQINIDNSNNYKHIFKEQIERDKEKHYYYKPKKEDFK